MKLSRIAKTDTSILRYAHAGGVIGQIGAIFEPISLRGVFRHSKLML